MPARQRMAETITDIYTALTLPGLPIAIQK
jgi:hypothetical protein